MHYIEGIFSSNEFLLYNAKNFHISMSSVKWENTDVFCSIWYGGNKNYNENAARSKPGDVIHLHTNLKIYPIPKTQQTPHLSHITPSKHHIAPNIVKLLIFQQSHILNNQIFKIKSINFLPYINRTTSLNTKENPHFLISIIDNTFYIKKSKIPHQTLITL